MPLIASIAGQVIPVRQACFGHKNKMFLLPNYLSQGTEPEREPIIDASKWPRKN